MSSVSGLSDVAGLLRDDDNPELDNFLSRVGEITKIINGLASDDQSENVRAIRQADILLHEGRGDGDFDEETACNVTSSRTVINNAPEEETGESGDMSQEGFKRMVEKDANKRAKDRKERKKKSDELRAKGNLAFKKGNYAEALDTYNKAISLIKDSPCLYTNRALTYIKIGIHSKAIEDCDQAIYINPDLIKPRLLKARASFNMAEAELARQVLQETRELFPEQHKMINEYEKDIFDLKMEKNYSEVKSEAKRKEKESQVTEGRRDVEEIWKKAARHELGQEEDFDTTL